VLRSLLGQTELHSGMLWDLDIQYIPLVTIPCFPYLKVRENVQSIKSTYQHC